MASKHSEQSKCERVAMASAGVGMCGGLRRRALTFPSGAGSKICIQPEEKGRGWSPLHGPELPVPEMESDSSKVKPDP